MGIIIKLFKVCIEFRYDSLNKLNWDTNGSAEWRRNRFLVGNNF